MGTLDSGTVHPPPSALSASGCLVAGLTASMGAPAAWRQPRRVLDASNTALDAACDVAWRAPARRICEASNAAMKVARQQPQRVLQASNAALGWGFGLLPLQARPGLGSKLLASCV